MTIQEFRKALKAFDCKLSVKSFSDFKACSVINKDGIKVNTQIMTQEHINNNIDVITFINAARGNIQDGISTVVV